jgi:hypothetical protein
MVLRAGAIGGNHVVETGEMTPIEALDAFHRRGNMIRLLIVLVVLLAGCAKSKPDTAEWQARGTDAVRPLKSSLQVAMLNGLAEGPESAIAVCREKAPELAAKASSDGVRVGRTSHKLRNPANAPKPWMLPLLNAYQAAPGDTTPKVVALEGGGVGYVEPIYVRALCVGCHGAPLAPSVTETIADLYPEDQATGYKTGDFRGIFWVEFDAE